MSYLDSPPVELSTFVNTLGVCRTNLSVLKVELPQEPQSWFSHLQNKTFMSGFGDL